MTDKIEKKKGWVVGVEGPVVEVKFDAAQALPGIYEVLETKTHDGRRLVLEVAEHRKGNVVRCVAMSSALNLQRGVPVTEMGLSIEVPTGPECFGRIMNVLGEPIDRAGPIVTKETRPIRSRAAAKKLDKQNLNRQYVVRRFRFCTRH